MEHKKLTSKEDKAAQEYIICLNKTEAYISSHATSKMKRTSINRKATELFQRPHVEARVRHLLEQKEKDSRIEINELVSTLAAMVRFDVSEFYDDNGCLKNVHSMSLTARQMISHIESQEAYNSKGEFIGTTKKIRNISKLDAIEKLMKHLGGYEKDNFQKKVEINTTVIKWGDKEITV
jgi:phage terminase small subunit